jgi:hypothetical protein
VKIRLELKENVCKAHSHNSSVHNLAFDMLSINNKGTDS